LNLIHKLILHINDALLFKTKCLPNFWLKKTLLVTSKQGQVQCLKKGPTKPLLCLSIPVIVMLKRGWQLVTDSGIPKASFSCPLSLDHLTLPEKIFDLS